MKTAEGNQQMKPAETVTVKSSLIQNQENDWKKNRGHYPATSPPHSTGRFPVSRLMLHKFRIVFFLLNIHNTYLHI